MGVLRGQHTRNQRGDSLRHIHWPSSAHRGELIVKELELEPSGDVWIVLDLDAAVHTGRATPALWNTLLSWRPAPRLRSSTGRSSAVGLLAVSGGATDTTASDASTVDVVAFRRSRAAPNSGASWPRLRPCAPPT
ncbi:MAG: DUF58 domain-containing protein [Caldilineaceae bacterium]